MILGNNRDKDIENIKNALEKNDPYAQVETDDPVLTPAQKSDIVNGYIKKQGTLSYAFKCFSARTAANTASLLLNKQTEIIGLENALGIKDGAIVTCNHFNQLDNTAVRFFCRKLGGGRLFTVSHERNFAMNGFVGFIMNYADTIPISDDIHYMNKSFLPIIEKQIKKGNKVLIYPEQEMWFNYRVPRPPKMGAYYYAAKLNVPVISCFVELIDLPEPDTDSFRKVKYRIHVLNSLIPDSTKTVRENSRIMRDLDEKQRIEAYEKIYGKKIDHPFDTDDIAGYTENCV